MNNDETLFTLATACILGYIGLQFTLKNAKAVPGVQPVLQFGFRLIRWFLRLAGRMIRQLSGRFFLLIADHLCDTNTRSQHTWRWMGRQIQGQNRWLPRW